MRPTRVLVVVAFLMGVALPYVFAAANTKKATVPVKKGTVTKAPVAASKSTPKKAVATKSATASKGTAKAPVRTATAANNRKRVATRSYAKTGRKVVAAPVYRGQQGPASDRYQEIQQVLIERGYMQGTPSGTWDSQTSDAMRRFQTEKNLPATGQLNSLSLIQLGLGPKRLAMVNAPTPSAQPSGDR